MDFKVDVHENMVISDSVTISKVKKVKDETKEISKIIEEIHRIRRNILIVLILLTGASLIPLITSTLAYDKIIYASVGVLTFISIFYSLLASKIRNETTRSITTYIDKAQSIVNDNYFEQIKSIQSNQITEAGKIVDEAKKKIEQLENIRSFIDLDYYLFATVFLLLLSIVYSLNSARLSQEVAYALFMGGLLFSITIAILWKSLPRIFKIFGDHLK